MDFIEFFQYIKTPATVLHVLSVVLGMGSALTADVLFSFYSKDKKLNPTHIFTLSLLSKVVSYSLIFIVLSGAMLFLSDVNRYIHSAKFLAKMSIVLVLLVNGYVLNKYIWAHLLKEGFFTDEKERGWRKLAFACGAISVISWLSACTLGVLNRIALPYTHIISIYLLVILCGVIVSQIVEKKELN